MLINPIKSMDVVSIKLTTGEEIVGAFLEKNEKIVKLRKPLALVMTQQGPSLAPFFMTGDIMNESVEVEFNANAVVAMIRPHKQFSDVYTQATSGLTTAAPTKSAEFKI